MNSILFVGMYPNEVCQCRNVFFQNLIFAVADTGVKCTVISPVSVSKYLLKTRIIPQHEIHKTPSGAEVDVYYPRYLSASSRQIGKFNTEHISERFFSDAASKAARKLAGEGKTYDCVYGHFFLYGGLAAMRIGRELGLPSFMAFGECDFESQVGMTYGLPKPAELEGLRGIVSVSSDNTNELHRLGIVEQIPILTAPNATDLSLFRPMDKMQCREKLSIPKDKFVVGFVGGFIERKGDKRLLEAIERIDGVYGAFAGVGDPAPSGEKVVFCRELDHADVSSFLNAVDVFCLPTLSEGSCNAIVEAMACGCPIISSDLPFNDDALNADNSIRLDPNSVDEIESAIRSVYEDRNLCSRLAEKSLETAKNFGIHERALRILTFMDKNCQE